MTEVKPKNKLYKISGKTELSIGEAVAEYRTIRGMLSQESRWASWYYSRLYDRSIFLQQKICNYYVNEIYKGDKL